MKMISPSLAANGLLPDPGRSTSVARSSSSATLPMGPGAVRPANGRGRFASFLAGQQDPSAHDGTEMTADEGRASAPAKEDGNRDGTATRNPAGPAQASSVPSGPAGHQVPPATADAAGADGSSDTGQPDTGRPDTDKQAEAAGSRKADDGASAAPPGREQAGQAQQAAASTSSQGLLLAAFMALPQPMLAGGGNQSRPDGGAGEEALAPVTGTGEAGRHAGPHAEELAAVSFPGMALEGRAGSGAGKGMEDLMAIMMAGRDKAASLSSVPEGTASSAVAGPLSDAAGATQGRDLMAGMTGHAGSQMEERGGLSGVSLSGVAGAGRAGEENGERQQTMRLAAASEPSALALQAATGGAMASVRMMAFQPGQPAGNAGAGGAGDRSVSFFRPEGGAGRGRGGEDALFALMVKASAQGDGASFAGSGGQGGSGGGPGEGAYGEGAGMTPGHADDGMAGTGGLSVGNASFAGLLGNGTDMAGSVLPEGHEAFPDGGMGRDGAQVSADGGTSPLQVGGTAPGVLTGHGATAPSGILNMTVMTADATPVHVQLARSAEGVAALSLQGGDDSMTDTLRKTHHILARQLDDAGLHAGVMKIDVLPAGSGHMADGQDQGMTGQQGQPGQDTDRHSGQPDGQADSWQGGFPAGGQGGDGGQGRQSPQGQEQALSASLPAGPEGGFRQEDAPFPASGGGVASRPLMAGRLNISV